MAEQAAPGSRLPSLSARLLSVLCLLISQPVKTPCPVQPCRSDQEGQEEVSVTHVTLKSVTKNKGLEIDPLGSNPALLLGCFTCGANYLICLCLSFLTCKVEMIIAVPQTVVRIT